MVESLTVNLGDRSYPIHFSKDVTAAVSTQIDALSAAGRKVVVVTDRNLARSQADALHAMFGAQPSLVLEPGEETKSLSQLGRVLDALTLDGDELDQIDEVAAFLVGMRRGRLRGRAS